MNTKQAKQWRKAHGRLRKRKELPIPENAYTGMVLLEAKNPSAHNRKARRAQKSALETQKKKDGKRRKNRVRKANMIARLMRRIQRKA